MCGLGATGKPEIQSTNPGDRDEEWMELPLGDAVLLRSQALQMSRTKNAGGTANQAI
jgi:hypothetical protein